MSQVFISYQHGEHDDFVRDLELAVDAAGFTPFLDTNREVGPLGIEPWMRHAIYSSDVVVFVVADDPRNADRRLLAALEPPTQITPLRMAARLRRRIPRVLRSSPLARDLPLCLARIHAAVRNRFAQLGHRLNRLVHEARAEYYERRPDTFLRTHWFASIAGLNSIRPRGHGWQSWERQIATSFGVPVVEIDPASLRGPESQTEALRELPPRLTALVNQHAHERISRVRRVRYRLAQVSLPFPVLVVLTALLIVLLLALVLVAVLVALLMVWWVVMIVALPFQWVYDKFRDG